MALHPVGWLVGLVALLAGYGREGRHLGAEMVLPDQELRELVIRGAHEHPGAVAVEDEYGRVLALDKLSRQACLLALLLQHLF